MAAPSIPSLTPYADRMEEGIQQMLVNFAKQEGDPQWDSSSIRINKSILPTMLRALGAELDMHTDPGKIMDGFISAQANFLASLIGTLVTEEGRVIAGLFALRELSKNLAERINPDLIPETSKTHIDFNVEEGTA